MKARFTARICRHRHINKMIIRCKRSRRVMCTPANAGPLTTHTPLIKGVAFHPLLFKGEEVKMHCKTRCLGQPTLN